MDDLSYLEKLFIGGAPLSEEAKARAEASLLERKENNPELLDDFDEKANEVIVYSRGKDDVDDLSHLSEDDLASQIMETTDQWKADGYLNVCIHVRPLGEVLNVIRHLIQAGEMRGYLWANAFRQIGELYRAEDPPELSEVQTCDQLFNIINSNQEILNDALYGLSEWLLIVSDRIPIDNEDSFWAMWDLLLPRAAHCTVEANNGYANSALNHPMGKLAEAVLKRLWIRKIEAGKPVDIDLLKRFTEISVGAAQPFILGRLMFAVQLKPLLIIFPNITKENLIPKLNWDDYPDEAPAMWDGFLWGASLSFDLWEAVKPHFLSAITHIDELKDGYRNFAHIFAEVLTGNPESLKNEEISVAFSLFSTQGLADIAQRFRMIMEADGIDKKEVWTKRIKPWFEYWPADRAKVTPQISNNLSLLIVESGDALDDVFGKIDERGLLVEVEYPGHIFHSLTSKDETGNPVRDHPLSVMKLLDKITPQNVLWVSSELHKIVDILDENSTYRDRVEMRNLKNRC